MADNVSITAGSGTTIAADDISGVQHQRVKISVGADGSATDMVGGAGAVSSAVPRVTLASDDPAVAELEAIADQSAFTIAVAPTVTAGAYSANDCLGGKQTLTNAAKASGGGGRLKSISMFDEGANGLVDTIDVFIFNADPSGSTFTDNGALAIVDADGPKIIACVQLDAIFDTGDGKFLTKTGLDIPYVCSGSANLYAVAVHRGTWAPDATDGISFTYHVVRD